MFWTLSSEKSTYQSRPPSKEPGPEALATTPGLAVAACPLPIYGQTHLSGVALSLHSNADPNRAFRLACKIMVSKVLVWPVSSCSRSGHALVSLAPTALGSVVLRWLFWPVLDCSSWSQSQRRPFWMPPQVPVEGMQLLNYSSSEKVDHTLVFWALTLAGNHHS